MSQPDNKQINYNFANVIVREFQVKEHPHDISDILESSNLQINTATKWRTDKKEQVLIDLYLELTSKIKKEKIDCFKANIRTLFNVENLNSFINDEGELEIDEQFLVLLTSLSYSTARGILKERLANSRYNQFILPIIDPKALISGLESNNKDIVEDN